MLKLIKKVLKTGTATVDYPAKPLDLSPNFRGKPLYNPQQCIACGACANACPSNALTMTPADDGETIRWSLSAMRQSLCGAKRDRLRTGLVAGKPGAGCHRT